MTVTSARKYDQGKKLFDWTKDLQNIPLLEEETFSTTIEDSNLVGNIYFSNYAKWLGRTIDLYFYKIIPEYYKKGNEEFVCLGCNIDYLGEAMPFDKIRVRMYLDGLYQYGMDLHFEFFLVEDSQIKRKLAYARYSAIWAKWENQSMRAINLPPGITGILYELRN